MSNYRDNRKNKGNEYTFRERNAVTFLSSLPNRVFSMLHYANSEDSDYTSRPHSDIGHLQ